MNPLAWLALGVLIGMLAAILIFLTLESFDSLDEENQDPPE